MKKDPKNHIFYSNFRVPVTRVATQVGEKKSRIHQNPQKKTGKSSEFVIFFFPKDRE